MIQICAYYVFKPLSVQEVRQLKEELEQMAQSHELRGLVLLGREGLNFTISGPAQGLEAFKLWLKARLLLDQPAFKDSWASKHPFHVFRVKVKKEIVTLHRADLVPSGRAHHLSPKDWHEKLQAGDAIVLDTRNDYEVEIGKFKQAIDLQMKEFHEFPDKLKQAALAKDQEILIYCTGGIRCEKALLQMQEQGFAKVYQLEGGILNYLKEYPHEAFDGECFVFDYRVAVDQNLEPSQTYRLCAHCGQPSTTELACSLCAHTGVVCHHCLGHGITTCSKNCANHARLGSNSRRPHLPELNKRHYR